MLFTAISLLAVIADPVQSEVTDEPVERIQVQGQFRAVNVHQAPTSVSVLQADTISARHGTHLEDVFNVMPNVNFSSGSSRARFMQIRGIGERSQFVDPINPSVGILIDGINYSGLGQAAGLFDISQVEVYRGPQSGRFGADGMAGMLVLESTQARDEFHGFWQLGAANYNAVEGGFAVGGGVGDLGRARLSVKQQRDDGFIENTYLGRDDTQSRSERSARFNLWSDITSGWQLRTTLHHYHQDNGYDAFSLDNTRQTYSDKPGQDDARIVSGRLAATYFGANSYELELSYSHLSADTVYSYDEDWTYPGIAPGWEYASTDAYWRNRDDHTIEARWVSTLPSQWYGFPTDWVFGWYSHQRDEHLQRAFYDWDADAEALFESDYQTQHHAVYGELTHHLTNHWQLTTGLRFEHYNNDYSDSNAVNEQPTDTMLGGRLSLSYQPDTDQLWYATWSRGYKAGGVNGAALGKVGDNPELEPYLRARANFAPEYLSGLELGYKYVSADEAVALNVAVFHQRRDQVQLKSWINRAQTFIGFIENADGGTTQGLEFELRWQPTKQLQWFANVGLLDSEIRGFVTEDGVDMTGRDQAQAPNYQLNTGVNWQLLDNLSASVQIDSKDSFYFSDSHNSRSDNVNLLHANLVWQLEHWTVTLWGRNLTDNDYATRGFYFGNDPRIEYAPKTYVQLGEPRRVGVTFNYAM